MGTMKIIRINVGPAKIEMLINTQLANVNTQHEVIEILLIVPFHLNRLSQPFMLSLSFI
jgi:hypothetical protein